MKTGPLGTRELLERARLADVLDAEARARMHAGILSKLARGEEPLPNIDASPLAVPSVSWLTKLLTSTAAKVGLSALAILLVGAGALLLARDARIERGQTRPLTAPSAEAPASAPARVTSLLPERPSKPAQTSTQHESTDSGLLTKPRKERAAGAGPARGKPAPLVRKAASPEPTARTLQQTESPADPGPRVAAIELAQERSDARGEARIDPPRAPRKVPVPPPSTLDAELGLMRRAYAQLNSGHPEQAFEILDEHAQRFPRGELDEAREIARMLALCAMDRAPAARASAQQFLALHPDSPFAGRARGMCPPRASRAPGSKQKARTPSP